MAERLNTCKVARITEQAAEWFVRLRDENLEPDERHSYVRWLKQSPTHLAEILRICQLAGRLHDAKLEGIVSKQESSSNIIEFPFRIPRTIPANRPVSKYRKSRAHFLRAR